MLNSSPSSTPGTSSALEMLTDWKSSWVILNEDQEAFPPLLLSLHHQNNKHAGTDSIGLPHWKFTATALAVKKLQAFGEYKAGPEQIFYFPHFTFICHNRFSFLRVSVLDLHCWVLLSQNIQDGRKVTTNVIPGVNTKEKKISITQSAGFCNRCPLQQKSQFIVATVPWGKRKLCILGSKYSVAMDICANMISVMKAPGSYTLKLLDCVNRDICHGCSHCVEQRLKCGCQAEY